MARKAQRSSFGYINGRRTAQGRLRYTAQYTRPDNGKRKTLGTYGTRQAAVVALAEVEKAIDRGEWTENYGKPEPLKGRTLSEAWEGYVSRRTKPLAASTLKTNRGTWERDIVSYWGADRLLASITKDDVWDWRNGPLKEERRQDNAALALFNGLLRAALSWDWIDKNPAEGINIPRKTKPLAERQAFTLVDIMEYLQSAEVRDRPLLATLTLSGLRSGELRALAREHIDLEGGSIRVERAVEDGEDVDGAAVLTLKAPKTKAGKRTVPISQTLVGILREHFSQNPTMPKALAFPGRDGGIMSTDSLQRAHYRTLANMGLRLPKSKIESLRRKGEPLPQHDHVRVHDLRASYAALLFERGYNLAEVMLVMGWDDPTMPQRIYARVFPERTLDMGAKIDAAIAEARKAAQ